MAKAKTNRIYRDGDRMASDIPTSEVKKLIIKDAADQHASGNRPIYTVYRKGEFKRSCRVIRKKIEWVKKSK